MSWPKPPGYISPPTGVTSVAGKTGPAVVLSSTDIPDFATAVLADAPVQSVAGKTGAVTLAPTDIVGFNGAVAAAVPVVTAASIGLGNVNNTADSAKPVSTAQATAISTAQSAAVTAAVAAITPASLGLGAPGVSLAVQNAAPTVLEFNFSTAMYQGSIPAVSALTVTKNGSGWAVSSFAWTSATKAIATMASGMARGDTALASFNEGTGPRLVTLGNNVPLPSFSAATVTNNVIYPTLAYTTQAVLNSTYQRSTVTGGGAGKGQGTIPVAISLSSASPVFARTRAASDGVTVLQPAWQASASATTGALSVTGVDARPVSFYLDLAPTSTGPWTNGTSAVQMGRVLGIVGQSLASAFLTRYDVNNTNASLGVTPSPNSRVFAGTDNMAVPTAWLAPSDASTINSTGVAELLRLQELAAGVPCAMVGFPISGQSIDSFTPTGTNYAKSNAALSSVSGFEAAIIFIGHTDSSQSTPSSDFRARMTTVFSDFTRRNLARGATYDKVVATIPAYNSTTWGGPEQVRAIRNAANKWCLDNGGIYVSAADDESIDGVHETQVGAITLARHFHRALRPGLGLTGGDAGPVITSATRSGVTITLAVSLPSGATSLVSVGNPATRFRVFAAGTTTTALALDATTPITVGTNTITLKLASDPGAAVDVHAFYAQDGTNEGQANVIYDNHTDGDGITLGRQLTPTTVPISTDGFVPAAVALGSAMTMTSDTYAANGAFGQQLTSGKGQTASFLQIPSAQSWTIECRLSVPAGASGYTDLFSVDSSGPRFEVSGNNLQLKFNFTNSTIPAFFVGDGLPHHLAICAETIGHSVYLDGNLVGVDTTNVPSAGQKNNFWIASFNGSSQWAGTIDEVAVFVGRRYTGSTYTVPTAPYAGTEPNIVRLWHLDGNGASATAPYVG